MSLAILAALRLRVLHLIRRSRQRRNRRSRRELDVATRALEDGIALWEAEE